MKIKTGIDIVEINRIEKCIHRFGDRFLNRVFTDKEIKYCESKNKLRFQHYAGRFSAKEAAFKAVSQFFDNKYEISWKDIEILNDNNGKPHLHILNLESEKIIDIDISISHCNSHAISNVVILYKE